MTERAYAIELHDLRICSVGHLARIIVVSTPAITALDKVEPSRSRPRYAPVEVGEAMYISL